MAYSSITKPSLHFNTVLYTGTDAAKSVTGVGFQPDFTWIKTRSHGGTAFPHILTDAVRGVNKTLFSNTNDAETTNYSNGYLSAFGTDGFTVTGQDAVSGIGRTYVGWNWKANGSGSANTVGDINSTVSANTTAGFSIVKYTGNATNSTVGHGLGVTPQVVIVKNLDSSGGSGEHWRVQHHKVAASKVVYLNKTDAEDTNGDFQNTYPTNSVFSISSADGCNKNGEENIAYCFAEKKGYSKFGLYTGNGNADGPFVYTGFKPGWVLWKRTDTTAGWYLLDTVRGTTNGNGRYLLPAENDAEQNDSSQADLLSNGFKLRNTDGSKNASGGTYIYLAFAENPLVANVGQGIPATAR